MAQTLVPQAVARLHTLAAAAVAAVQPPVSVFLGEPTGGDIPAAYVAVAYAGEEVRGVAGQRVRQTSSEHWAEEFDVWCTVSTSTGDENAPQQLADTDALYHLVANAFEADRQLGGLLLGNGRAELGSYEWTIEQGGAVASVYFTVHVFVAYGM